MIFFCTDKDYFLPENTIKEIEEHLKQYYGTSAPLYRIVSWLYKHNVSCLRHPNEIMTEDMVN